MENFSPIFGQIIVGLIVPLLLSLRPPLTSLPSQYSHPEALHYQFFVRYTRYLNYLPLYPRLITFPVL